jgi:serine/threonine protein kinase
MQSWEKMSKVYSQYALPVGTMVQEYKIIQTLETGNFGIVYTAQNKYFSEVVALKEFLPTFLARRSEGEHRVRPLSSNTEKAYEWSRHKFLQEAKTLRELGHPVQHPNIVRVIQFIEANDTAYMVMDLEEGLSLKMILEERGPLAEKEIISIQNALLDGLERVHEANIWHRDIKPSNILIRPDGSPVLIDFGAARKDITGTDRSTMAVYSPAFAAPEQIHPIADQGPWTDIYSLGATLYRAVTGELPTNASKRMQKEELLPAAKAVEGKYSASFLKAIDAALEFDPKSRPQSISEWKKLFEPRTEAALNETAIQPKPNKDCGTKRIKPLVFALAMTIIAVVTVGMWIHQRTDQPADSNQTFYPIANAGPSQPDKMNNSTMDVIGKPEVKKPPILIQADLKINSIPDKAEVFVDGDLKGVTPLSAEVVNGMHQIRLSLEGHFDWESNLFIEEAGEIQLRIPLLKK